MTNQDKVRDRKYNFYINTKLDVISATSTIHAFAAELGFASVFQSMIATALSELGMNIVKYAGSGSVIAAAIYQKGQYGIELIAEDHGPGISDRAYALKDNMSTGNTLGLGLPGVKRLMDEFFMDSSIGLGTKIVVRKWMPKTC